MEDMDRMKLFLKELANKKTANPKEIADALSMEFSNERLDRFIEELHALGWIDNLHKQSRNYSLPDYDQISITEEGMNYIENS